MRAAEAARWKEQQLAKTHAEAGAARKRGAELGEPYKAALEQKKQISAEMRALPHTQQLVRHGRMSILDRRERLEYERVTAAAAALRRGCSSTRSGATSRYELLA